MITAKLTVNTKLLDDIGVYVDHFYEEVAQPIAADVFNTYGPQMLDELQHEPPAPSYPEGEFPWVNERQQRRVMMLLTMQAIARGDYTVGPRGGKQVLNVRYRRTHEMADGYSIEPSYDQEHFALKVSNPSGILQYVAGTFNQRSIGEATKHVQPFHADRWTPAAATIRFWFDAMKDEYQSRVRNQFSGDIQVIARRRSRIS